MAEHLYHIEACWGLNPTKTFWVPLALTDSALMSSMMLSSGQFLARVSGRQLDSSALGLLQNAIQILNERLQGPLEPITDSTIAAVAGLALTEVLIDIARILI